MTHNVEGKYKQLDGKRSSILTRVEDYAAWTLPSIFPYQNTSDNEELQNDIQSFGAQAVNHLSNKLMLGLFGPSRPFFRLTANEKMKTQMATAGISEDALSVALQNAEKESVKEMNRMGSREPLTALLQHLIITGNCLMFFPDDGDMQIYGLRDYVVERDTTGFAFRMMVCDKKRFGAFPASIQLQILSATSKPKLDDEHELELITAIEWDAERKKYIVTQHAEGVQVNKTDGVFPKDKCPYIPLVWKLVRGEDYGRGLVEDYSGDFHSLSTGEEAELEIMGIISQIKGMVDPTGLTNASDLNDAENGAFVSGREEDISLVHYGEKMGDLQALEAFVSKKERRLSRAFLMDSAGVRDAERVTAEEIRLIARDLEMALGGVYTRLSQTLQLPIARQLLVRIDFKLAGDLVEPIIVTGLDALSRSGDLESYRLFVRDLTELQQIQSPTILAELNIGRIVRFIAVNNNFDTEIALNTPDEKTENSDAQAEAQEAAIQDDIRMQAEPKIAEQQALNGGQ